MRNKWILYWMGLITVFVIISNISNAQWICSLMAYPPNPAVNDEINVIVTTSFPFGYQSTCPSLNGFSLIIYGNMASLELFYDISGCWPLVGCSTTDTANTGKWNPGSYQLIIYSNTIFDADTSFHHYTDTLHINIADQQGIKNDSEEKISIFPNPTRDIVCIIKPNDLKINSIELYDIAGNRIKKFNKNVEQLSLGEIKQGLYQLVYTTAQKRYYQKLIVK